MESESEEEGEEEEDEEEEEENPDVSGDVALAESLAGKRVSARNLDKKGKQFKKAAALAKIREVRFTLFFTYSFMHNTCLTIIYDFFDRM